MTFQKVDSILFEVRRENAEMRRKFDELAATLTSRGQNVTGFAGLQQMLQQHQETMTAMMESTLKNINVMTQITMEQKI